MEEEKFRSIKQNLQIWEILNEVTCLNFKGTGKVTIICILINRYSLRKVCNYIKWTGYQGPKLDRKL